MSAEHRSALPISALSFSNAGQLAQGYYRSKLFIAPYASNPLIAAAGPLFSLTERLCISQALPAITSIRDNIEHELKAFQSKLNASGYSNDLISIAYYLLCASLDEIIGKSYLRLFGDSPDFKAFTPLTNDGDAPQKKFFEIIDYIKERPGQYLDLVELSYFCLIAGFEGEQHLRADGRQYLDNLIEELYLLIQKHRVNKPCRLYQEKITPDIVKKHHKPVYIAISLTLGILFSTVWLSHTVIENHAKKLLHGHFQHSLLEQ